MTSFHVDVLYAPECRHLTRTLHEVQEGIRQAGVDPLDVVVNAVRCDTLHAARERGLTGSPTVRVNGHDVAHETSRPHLACREYVGEDHYGVPFPPADLVADALRHAHAPRWYEREDQGRILGYHA